MGCGGGDDGGFFFKTCFPSLFYLFSRVMRLHISLSTLRPYLFGSRNLGSSFPVSWSVPTGGWWLTACPPGPFRGPKVCVTRRERDDGKESAGKESQGWLHGSQSQQGTPYVQPGTAERGQFVKMSVRGLDCWFIYHSAT